MSAVWIEASVPYAAHMAANDNPTAAAFVERLATLGPAGRGDADPYAGIGMGQIFTLAKEFKAMAPAEIEQLLESDHHAVKAPPLHHPIEQPVPGPSGRVPPDWDSLLHD
jgi:hypothetical protein